MTILCVRNLKKSAMKQGSRNLDNGDGEDPGQDEITMTAEVSIPELNHAAENKYDGRNCSSESTRAESV